MRSRPLTLVLLLFMLSAQSVVGQELLFAELSSDPEAPSPNEAFELRILLTDSDEQGVEDLELLVRIVPAGGGVAEEGENETTRVPLHGAGDGVYRARVPALTEGSYRLILAEVVDREVRTEASTNVRIDGDSPIDTQVVLPASEGELGNWLAWLLGLPLLAGLLVILLLLTGRRRTREAKRTDDGAEE